MKSAKHVYKSDNAADGQPGAGSIRRLSIDRRGSPGTSTANYSNAQILDEDDDFQDAVDIEAPQFEMDLDRALEEAKLAINYFFNNKFEEARNLMQPWANSSMYHSIGACVFAFLEAILTFEHQHIQEASESLKRCLSVCNRYRRKNTITESLGKTFRRPNYDQYTETEVHAELCSAEALLLKAMLTFIEDETLSSLIKGGMKIRNCFNSYKECAVILNQRKWSSDSSKAHFESGVRMGIGSFNLMISLLPGRVIKLLEFIGFSGNKQVGLQDLVAGYNLPGIRQVLCVMQLLGYHLIVCFVLSHQEGDLDFCDDILTKQLAMYPEGAWFLFFKGRLEFMKGNLDESIKWYKKSWRSQNVWPQFHHLCFWELLWVNCLKLDWRESSLYAGFLVEGSRWSRTIYSYQKAAVLLMLQPNELSDLDRKTIDLLMKDAPAYKQRIAGKSLPMEKFICKKCDRFFAQKRSLVLPAIELMYVWNIFKVTGKHFHIADGILRIIDKKLNELLNKNHKEPYDTDNKALTLLLKGACLRYLKSPLQAIKCLEQVIAFKSEIKEDTYLIPYAIVEIGLIYADQGQKDAAIACMEDVKKNYTGYSLESRLHFRIHAALTDLKEGPMAHDQPTYASVPGIRVFGMMCVKPGYSVRKPSVQPPKRYQLQKPYYIPNTQNKYGIIKDNRPSSSASSSGGYQQQSPIHDSYQLQHQANYQYLNRPESSPIIGSGSNTHKDYSDIQINHFSPGSGPGSVYGRNNERKTNSIVAEDSSDITESDQDTIENSTGSGTENQDEKTLSLREKRSIPNDIDSLIENEELIPEFPWDKVMEFQSSLVWEE